MSKWGYSVRREQASVVPMVYHSYNELLDTTYPAPSLESLDMTCWYGVSKRLEIEQEDSFILSFF